MRLVYTSTWCSMYWINATLVKHPDVFTLIQFCVCAREWLFLFEPQQQDTDAIVFK